MAHSLYHISQMGPSGRMLLPLNSECCALRFTFFLRQGTSPSALCPLEIQGSVFAMMRRKSDGAIRGATFTQSTFNDQR